jgi:hypothetical protein
MSDSDQKPGGLAGGGDETVAQQQSVAGQEIFSVVENQKAAV